MGLGGEWKVASLRRAAEIRRLLRRGRDACCDCPRYSEVLGPDRVRTLAPVHRGFASYKIYRRPKKSGAQMKHLWRCEAVLLLAAAWAAESAGASNAPPRDTLSIVDVTVIDGTGAP